MEHRPGRATPHFHLACQGGREERPKLLSCSLGGRLRLTRERVEERVSGTGSRNFFLAQRAKFFG